MAKRPHPDEDWDESWGEHPITALAKRVNALTDELRETNHGLAELENDYRDLIERCPTKEQIAVLATIVTERQGREWFASRLRFYGWGLLAFLVAIWTTRDYIGPFFTLLGKLIKP